jgi:hypothetical protein
VGLSATAIVLVLVLVLGLGLRRAAAEPTVEVTGDAPFAPDELVAALAVRVGERDVRVHITPTASGVIVAIAGASRVVPLAGARGPAAARLVALAASDLVLVDLATPPSAAPGEAAVSEPVAAVTGGVVAPARERTTVAITGSAAGGWDGTLAGVTVSLAVPRGRWLVAADLGGVALSDRDLDLVGAVIRVGGGRRFGWLDVRAGAIAAPISVGAGAGDRTVLFGAGASAWARLRLGGSVRAVLAGGVDAFATRSEYRMNDAAIGATPWIAPWVAAGLEVVP